MPSFTFVTTATAFATRGAVPVFVDINENDMNIDPELISSAITPKTKAIIPVHYAGKPCDMDRINTIAEHNNLFVIEDTAHALLSYYKGKALGTLGHFGCLSFHETKNIICGEGGALIINDPEFVERARIIWDKGTNRYDFFKGKTDKYSWVDLGSSFYPSELASAFLFGQLERANEINRRRIAICTLYRQRLLDLEKKGHIRIGMNSDEKNHNGHIFYIIVKSENERKNLIKYLADRSIHAVFHYVPLHSSPAGQKFGRCHGPMNVTNNLSARLLRLPLHFKLTDTQVNHVADAIHKFYEIQ
jgi:dTDP-4-amino-4,6-dideoxygalactose transaminase